MSIQFDYKGPTARQPSKLIIRCTDTDLFDNIREHFSVENTGARFARRYARFAPRRKYVITPTGTCELGLYWEVRQYLIKNQINEEIILTDKLSKAIKVGIETDLFDEFKFTLREYQEEVIRKAMKIGTGTCVLGTGAGKTFTTAALIENFFRVSKDKDTFKCLMLVPDLGLVTQTYEEFLNCGTTYKLTKWTGKNKPDFTANVIVANIGIIQSRFDDNDWLKYIDLLIVDECVKPGTLIDTKEGKRPIEEVVVGDIVMSYNKELDVKEYKKVTNTYKNKSMLPYIKIKTTCGKEVTVTTNHKVYTSNRGYVEAGNLTKDDELLSF